MFFISLFHLQRQNSTFFEQQHKNIKNRKFTSLPTLPNYSTPFISALAGQVWKTSIYCTMQISHSLALEYATLPPLSNRYFLCVNKRPVIQKYQSSCTYTGWIQKSPQRRARRFEIYLVVVFTQNRHFTFCMRLGRPIIKIYCISVIFDDMGFLWVTQLRSLYF